MEPLHKIPVILDGDPGHDDAIAWTIARTCPEFEILAITTLGGNSTIEKT
ncbi:MAG: nucleoside hydrolase, partial [Oscillospiraceae bacterium]|nr:nucleoside hydrolase [Oscillospiraceae bacterium]